MSTASETALLEFIDDNSATLVAVAQSLMKAPSPNPPGDVRGVAKVATEAIENMIPGSNISIYESATGIANVVAVIKGCVPGRRLVFSGHLDTFPPGDASLWTKDPYSGHVSEDGARLYGRGAADMKGGIAASILAAKALAQQKELWAGDIVIALAGDEETMGVLGSGYLLENVPAVAGHAMICGDAGSPSVIRIGEKGLVWVEIEATGSAAHGAHVHRGVNAIDTLLLALQRLKSLETVTLNSPTEVNDVIETAKKVSEPLGGKGESAVLSSVTVNIGKISGGSSPNLVADKASASADIRIPIGMTVETLSKHIQDLMSGNEGVQYRITRGYDPSWTSPDEEIVQCTLQAAQSLTNDNTVLNMRVGASDARLFRQAGIPSVVLGLTPYNMGGADEYIEISELVQLCKIHALAAFQYLSREPCHS